jgi:asparagine synthase (glutamine-hydrolysing)
MCGFAGFVDFRLNRPPEGERVALLEQMGRLLAHRGPDEQSYYDDGCLSLVFRRLSIIDKSGGAQPIWNEDGSMFVAANGEIYDHREIRTRLASRHVFRTLSDTECFLHQFEESGTRAVEQVMGDFALLVWNRLTRELFLARDRVGVKPLLVVELPGVLLFGSELKALLAHPLLPRRLRWRDLDEWGRSLKTYVEGVEMIPAGCWATYGECYGYRQSRYWDLSNHFPQDGCDTGRSAADFVSSYRECLSDSIQRRLMSEAPIGAFLSGGLDSATVVAGAAAHSAELHCFTVVEENGHAAGDPQAAERLAHRLRLPFHPLLLDSRVLVEELDFGLEAFERFIWQFDWPRFELEWLLKHELHRYARNRVPGIKVILSGQGADEFAGGYSNPFDRPNPDWDAYIERELAPNEQETRRRLLGVPSDLGHLLNPRLMDISQPKAIYHREMAECAVQIQNHNLWHEDRCGMAHGIEVRVPFLDHRLLELLAAVPGHLHARLFWDKSLVREAACQWLPVEFTRRPKVRFFLGRRKRAVRSVFGGLVRRIFPLFREKYLNGNDALFQPEEMAHLYGAGQRHEAPALLNRLLRCMAIAVFEANLRRPLVSAPAGNACPLPPGLKKVPRHPVGTWRFWRPH